MKKRQIVSVLVKMPCPENTKPTDIARYIRDAVQCWRRGSDPNDALSTSNISDKHITARLLKTS